jgi:hypothetical protein
MINKKIGLMFLSLIIVISITSLVSAAYYGTFSAGELRNATETIIQWIQDILGPFFEIMLGTSSYDSFFYAKVLLLILLFALINFALNNVEMFRDKPIIGVIVSAIVSIFAVRYLQENDFISGILLPTGALGIALIVLLPIVIYFLFIHKTMRNSSAGRRIAWIFFFVIFLVIWLRRRTEIPSELNWIYSLGLVILIINIIFDSQIHGYFDLQGLHRWRGRARDRRIALLQAEYTHLVNQIGNNAPTREQSATLREIWRQLQREGAHGNVAPLHHNW